MKIECPLFRGSSIALRDTKQRAIEFMAAATPHRGPLDQTARAPAAWETRPTGLKSEIWLKDQDSHQDGRSQMGYSAGRLALRGAEGCCASG
jgi:hypothetical protein